MVEHRLARTASAALGGALLVTLAFLVAGCGGGGSGQAAATTTTPTTSTGTTARGFGGGNQAFTACLSAHGIDTSKGGFGFFGGRPRTRTGTTTTPRTGTTRNRPPGGFQRPQLTPTQQKAFQACRSKLPNGGNFGRGGGGQNGQNGQNPAFAKYTACLKKHGVTFGQSSSQSAFQKAQTACAKFRPAGNGGSQATTG